MNNIRNLANDLKTTGFATRDYEYLATPEFLQAADNEYADAAPGENASNQLKRKIGWAVMAGDRIIPLKRGEYVLSKELNPEEGGRVRRFRPLTHGFMLRREMIRLYLDYFKEHFDPSQLSERAFEIQLSAIRYEPTLEEPAWPSPLQPHQDQVDGAIVCLNRKGPIVGGVTRVFTLKNEPIAEVNLRPGQALLIEDARVKHQVSPVMLEPDENWVPGDPAYRDVLLIRIQPLGR